MSNEEEKLKTEIERIKKEIAEKAGTIEKAEAGFIEPTEEIPEEIIAAKTPKEARKIGAGLKVKELEKKAFAPAEKSWEDIFKEAYNTSGLADIKKQINDIDAKIDQKNADLLTAEGEISENPWLSEAGRVGRTKKLYDMAQKEITNLVNKRKQLTDTYNAGIDAAEKVATRTTTGYEREQALTQKELAYFSKIAEGKGEEEEILSPSEAKMLGVKYGTTKKEAQEMGIIPKGAEKTSWTEFSSQEKRKLVAAGIDWTTEEGYEKAIKYLYPEKEEKTFLSTSDYRNLAAMEIPKEVADAIAIALSEGNDLESIRRGLAEVYGREKGYSYLDKMMPYLQKKKDEFGNLIDILNKLQFPTP